MQISSNELAGKVALVTGASRGIGQAIAALLAKAGAVVIGTATTENGALNITNHFKALNLSVSGKVLNFNELNSIEPFLDEVKTSVGPVSILVNNAAITQDNLILRMKPDEWDQVIQTNLSAVFRITKGCVRDMVKARWGRIINIGSVVGVTGNPGQVNYCASKAGVEGLTRSLALELGSRNITVNTVAPGFVKTDMTDALSSTQQDVIMQKIPLQRPGSPDDIAYAVFYLASVMGAYVTGQTLHVNGGMYLSS